MILGVNIFSLIPMRAEPRDAAEMVSQVLFGRLTRYLRIPRNGCKFVPNMIVI